MGAFTPTSSMGMFQAPIWGVVKLIMGAPNIACGRLYVGISSQARISHGQWCKCTVPDSPCPVYPWFSCNTAHIRGYTGQEISDNVTKPKEKPPCLTADATTIVAAYLAVLTRQVHALLPQPHLERASCLNKWDMTRSAEKKRYFAKCKMSNWTLPDSPQWLPCNRPHYPTIPKAQHHYLKVDNKTMPLVFQAPLERLFPPSLSA